MTTIYRLPTVRLNLGVSRSTIYANIKNGLFIKPIRLGERSVGWPSTEVQTLINARVSGKTDSEIKTLVAQLESQRQLVGGI